MDPYYFLERDIVVTPRDGVENNDIELCEYCDITSPDGDWELKVEDYYIIYKNIKYKYIRYSRRSGMLIFCSENDDITEWAIELRQTGN